MRALLLATALFTRHAVVHTQQSQGSCGAASFAAAVQRVMDTCCPPPPPLQPGEAPHPPERIDCTLPSNPTAACADEFLPFFDRCYEMLESQPNLPLAECEFNR